MSWTIYQLKHIVEETDILYNSLNVSTCKPSGGSEPRSSQPMFALEMPRPSKSITIIIHHDNRNIWMSSQHLKYFWVFIIISYSFILLTYKNVSTYFPNPNPHYFHYFLFEIYISLFLLQLPQSCFRKISNKIIFLPDMY